MMSSLAAMVKKQASPARQIMQIPQALASTTSIAPYDRPVMMQEKMRATEKERKCANHIIIWYKASCQTWLATMIKISLKNYPISHTSKLLGMEKVAYEPISD